jgi:2-polyprenyl-6-methoxyphenol hydroxylase-like FAD-dependent oxidoreductase
MIVVIAGGGRTGTQLASFLLGQDHEVRLIEHRKDVLARLHLELPTEVIYEGMLPTQKCSNRPASVKRRYWLPVPQTTPITW